MNKLIKNYIYNASYQIFLVVVPLITAPYLARVLGANNLGIYSYINSISSIITNIGLLGLNNYGIRQTAYYRGDKQKIDKLFSELMILRMLLLLVISAVYFYCIMNTEYKVFFLIQYLLIFSVFADVSWVMIGEEDMGVVAFRNFAAKFLSTVGIFLLVKTANDLWIYFLLYSGTTLVTTICLWPYIRKYAYLVKVNIRGIKKHIIPSIRVFLPQIATILYLQVDKVMLKFFTNNTSQISFYDQAEKIVMIPLAVITALGNVFMPRIAAEYKENNKDEISRYLQYLFRFGLMLSFPMMIGIAVISNKMIPWYLGWDYYPTVYAIIIISPIITINTLTSISGTMYFTATDQISIMTLSYTLAAILNIIVNALLIPSLGYIGVAISTVIASIVSVIIQYRKFNQQINVIKMISKCWHYLISAIIMGVICYIIAYSREVNALTTIIQVSVGGLIYFMMMILFKDDIMIETIKKIFRKVKKEGNEEF